MKKILIFFSLFFIPQAFAASAAQNESIIPYKVNLDTAHRLVKTGTGIDYKEGFTDLQAIPDKNGFFIMHVAGKASQIGEFIDLTGKHTPVFEWYYVNAWTGDVWSNCQRLSNPALHEPLARVKALFQGDELKMYEGLRRVPAYQMHVGEAPDVTRCAGPEHADYSAVGAAARESVQYKINVHVAYALIKMATKREDGLDSNETPDENGFFIVDRYGNHDGVEARYAVNAWTGDVWDLFSCSHLSNSALRKAQAAIKQGFNADEINQYPHVHALHALGVDLEPCP